jgi:hypothetical protein
MSNTLTDQVLAAWRDEPVADQYAARSKPNVHSPALFDDDGDARWTKSSEWDESKHPRVEKGSKSAHGGQFTSINDSENNADLSGPKKLIADVDKGNRTKEGLSISAGQQAQRKKMAETMTEDEIRAYFEAQGGDPAKTEQAIKETIALKPGTASPGIIARPTTVPNEAAKAGDQLGLFGEAEKPAYKKPVFKPTLPESTGKQSGLFDTTGNMDQMDLFGGAGIPEDLTFNPDSKKKDEPTVGDEQPASIETETATESKPKAGKPSEYKESKAKTNFDFGEQLDVRKFNSRKLGPRETKAKVKDDRPSWQKRYDIAEDANDKGKYFIADKRTNRPYGKNDVPGASSNSFSSRIDRMLSGFRGKPNKDNFDSKEEALQAMHHIEANRNHVVVPDREGKWEIARKFGESKRATVKGGFETREQAESHLRENPASIIEHEFPRYEDHQYLDHVERTGKEHRKGDIAPTDMKNAFGFRAGAFGNWQSDKKTGQVALNHAYDAFHDLSDILGLPPKAVSLNGQLAMGFGADGTGGRNAARAHYAPDKGLINLTKMTGAGTLAHEWMHALDHHMAKIAGDKHDSRTAKSAYKADGLRPELHEAYQGIKNAMHSKQITEAIRGPDESLQQKIDAKKQKEADELAEAKQNDKHIFSPHTVGGHLWNIRKAMHETAGYKKKKIDPEKLKEFDKLSAEIEAGNYGEKAYLEPGKNASSFAVGRETYTKLEELNQLHKAMVGKGFHTNDDHSRGKQLKWQITSDLAQKARVKDAEDGKTETKKKKTSYLEEAHKMDSQRSSDYYTMPEEMMSRAFEAYIHDKLAERGHKSDYLGAKAHNKHYKAFGMKPFPEGEERGNINKAFDKFFKELKHEVRSDDKGDHVNLYQAASEKTSWAERYENELEPLIYDERAENRARDLYNQVSAVIDRYDWNESQHPRHPGGSPRGGQFSSKTRDLPDHPGLDSNHSMHITRQDGAIRQNLSDWSKGLNRLIANSHRMQGGGADVSEEQLWAGINKDELRKQLDYMNKLDKHHRENGGPSIANLVNANGLIPKMIAERLHGGSRFFDIRKLRGKLGVPKPAEQSTDQGKTFPGAPAEQSNAPIEQSGNGSQKSLPGSQSPAVGSQNHQPENPVQTPQQQPIETGLSKQQLAKLDKAISSLIGGDNADMVGEFRDIVMDAWQQKKQEAIDHNEAIRTITGAAAKLSGAKQGAATPQALSALVRAARNRTLDPSVKRGFDEMVDSAERSYPHLLGGRGEDGLMDLLSEGVKQVPDVMDESVIQHAMSMAGPNFFASHDQGESFEDADSTNWDSVPFSWLAAKAQVEVMRYSHRSNPMHVAKPTEAQREAGNYRMAHFEIHGLKIAIETPKGRKRRPEWHAMAAHYGYVKSTKGNDGDSLDVFVGPNRSSEMVYVVDQSSLNGQFDEHKAMIGFDSRDAAVKAYRDSYKPGWKVGPVTSMTIDQFKAWVSQGNLKKPVHSQVSRYSELACC